MADFKEVQANYQYVGLFFVVCGALCYFPYVLWEWFENGVLKSLLQDLMSITLVEEDEPKLFKQSQKLATIWQRNRPIMLDTYASANILCEICNLVSLLVIFCMGDVFLGGYFTSLGVGVGVDSGRNFPKMANCAWNTGSVLYQGVCTMNMNYLSEKLFYISW